MDWKLIIAIIGPVATAVGGYLIAKRTTSGSIDTSDAATLWAESQAMRKELRDEVVNLRDELKGNKKELAATRRQITILQKRIALLEEHDDKQ